MVKKKKKTKKKEKCDDGEFLHRVNKRERTKDLSLITCIFKFHYYHIKSILSIILCNYDACYHSFVNFLHQHFILIKSIFLHYLGLIMCFY